MVQEDIRSLAFTVGLALVERAAFASAQTVEIDRDVPDVPGDGTTPDPDLHGALQAESWGAEPCGRNTVARIAGGVSPRLIVSRGTSCARTGCSSAGGIDSNRQKRRNPVRTNLEFVADAARVRCSEKYLRRDVSVYAWAREPW